FAVEDVDQDILTSALTARLGVTDRFELEAKVPYVYRSSTRNITVPVASGGSGTAVERQMSGSGLGDIELAMHYQLNGGDTGPFFVGNLRFKSTTGKGPFEVERNALGVALEPSLGSGFYSVTPSLTV